MLCLKLTVLNFFRTREIKNRVHTVANIHIYSYNPDSDACVKIFKIKNNFFRAKIYERNLRNKKSVFHF